MMELINHLEYWHWLVLGLVLMIVEILAPSALFIWFGVAAGIVGLIMLLMPELTWQTQFLMFSILSISTLFAWRAYAKKHPDDNQAYATLNKRGEDLIGRTFTLGEGVMDGYGKIKVDDTMWKIRCDKDVSAGAKVRVVEVDGTVLVVQTEP